MAECPICGLGDRCRNHWIASQDAGGEIHFQTGPMTASDDNLILVQNKLGRPDLKVMMSKLGVEPRWIEQDGLLMAYLAWPLDLRAAVNRALFPSGPPGASPVDPDPVPTFRHTLDEINVAGVELDAENCLPDELLYHVGFNLRLSDFGEVALRYSQVLWDEFLPWSEFVRSTDIAQRTRQTVALMFSGLLDPLRATFAGQLVDVLAEDQPNGLVPGCRVDELARVAAPEAHLGEVIESLVNERRLQPMLRAAIGGFALAAKL